MTDGPQPDPGGRRRRRFPSLEESVRDELGCTLRARWVFPVDGPPIAGGVVTIHGNVIVEVGQSAQLQTGSTIDLGDVALIPGLVNAHTHLEFSDLRRPLGEPGMPLPTWIGEVLAARTERVDTTGAILAGLIESIASGVTTIGEIASEAWPASVFERLGPSAPHVAMFRELIGLGDARISAALAAAAVHLAEGERPVLSIERHGLSRTLRPIPLRPALSPHAPYTVHPRLLAGAVALAAEHRGPPTIAHERRVPVAMHLAESREELELLAAGTGPMADLLKNRGVWQPDLFGGRSVREFLEALSAAPRSLVIHGNYLADDELALAAQHAQRMSVVYCPRTHAYFDHPPYPLARMLAAGVAMAVGTDSRASNPDLSLLEELRQIASRHADVPPAKILELGTLAGARALGWGRELGSMGFFKRADFCVIPIGARNAHDPHELLFDCEARVSETWIDGRCVARAEDAD